MHKFNLIFLNGTRFAQSLSVVLTAAASVVKLANNKGIELTC